MHFYTTQHNKTIQDTAHQKTIQRIGTQKNTTRHNKRPQEQHVVQQNKTEQK